MDGEILQIVHRVYRSLRSSIVDAATMARRFALDGTLDRRYEVDIAHLERRVMMSSSPLPSEPLDPDSGSFAVSTALEDAFTENAFRDTPGWESNEWLGEIPRPLLETDVPLEDAWRTGTPVDESVEVVIVDTTVEGYEALVVELLASVPPDSNRSIQVVELDPDNNGIEQVSRILDRYEVVDAVHMVSHGARGQVKIGDTWLSTNNISQHAAALRGWNAFLSPDADLLFYGCNLAASPEGQSLAKQISELCDCDVAASIDATGSGQYEGDWELEYSTGVLSVNSLSVDDGGTWSGKLASLLVDTTLDVVDGDTTSVANLVSAKGSDGLISLREAILATNNDAGGDTIFLGAGTYSLTLGSGTDDQSGDLDIRNDVSIVGVSPSQTIIDGSSLHRVFEVHSDSAIHVVIENIKVQNGTTSNGETQGAGLFVRGTGFTPEVSLSNVWFAGNHTSGTVGSGGAIANRGSLTVENALIEGNSSELGGGVANLGGTLSMTNVTLSGNTATTGEGGGIYNSGTAVLQSVTVASNTAATTAGGIYNDNAGGGATNLSNTLVANNLATTSPDLDGAFVSNSGDNLIEAPGSATGLHGSDITGVDPLIAALAQNDGSTMTHALQSGSLAIDAGSALNAPTVDQRGVFRDTAPDIGAYEAIQALPSIWLSTSGDVSSPSGVTGLEAWGRDQALTLGDPNLAFGSGTTDGTLANVFNLDGMVNDGNANLDALHYVSSDITVGSANAVTLRPGDVLFSTSDTEEFGALSVGRNDVVLFQPDTPGDYSSGTFSILLDNLSGVDVYSISLVEETTVFGDTTLQQGDFVFTHFAAWAANDVFLFETNDVGAGTTSGNTVELIEGSDIGLNVFSSFLLGTELIETDLEIGGLTLPSGTLLVHSTGSHSVGTSSTGTTTYDIFALDVTSTTLVAGTAVVDAAILVQGSDLGLNTSSESINALAIGPGVVPNEVIVDTTSDVIDGATSSISSLLANRGADGFISLREAITATNNSLNGTSPDRISFDIAGSGPHIISLSSALPQITETVIIDGSTEPNFLTSPVIQIDGSSAGDVDGLVLSAGSNGSTIRDLALVGFNGASQGRAILVESDGNLVTGNFSGVATDGSTVTANRVGVRLDSGASGNTIGGVGPGDRNVLSGNAYSGISINGSGTDDNLIFGNYIGTDATGSQVVGNGTFGVVLWDGASGNTIGGINFGEANVIAGARDGVAIEGSGVGTSIRGNVIYSNTQQGIDLGNDDTTSNDAGDGDSGPNGRQNYPVLTAASLNGAELAIAGTFNSTDDTTFTIDLYSTSIPNAGGHGGAETHLGSFSLTTDGSGDSFVKEVINIDINDISVGDSLSATATDPNGSTSEFSSNVLVVPSAQTTLWLSTKNDVNSDGVGELDSWRDDEVLRLDNPNFELEPVSNVTSATVNRTIDFDTLAGTDVGVDALHYVTRDIQLGTSNFDVLEGDVLFSVEGNETLDGLSVDNRDVVLFRPDTLGDYTSGTFQLLLEDPLGANLRGIALVEQDTVVGDHTLQAGDFLLSRGNKEVKLWETSGVGSGTTTGTESTYLDGTDSSIGVDKNIHAIDFIETDTTIGGHTINSGSIILAADGNATVGTNSVSTTKWDYFSLEVTQTTLVSGDGNGVASATLIVEGADLGLSGGSEELYAVTSFIRNPPPVFTSPSVATASENQTSVMTVTATDDSPVSYSIVGGADSGEFSIGATTGVLTFVSAPNFEGATDANTDNIYELIVQADDGLGGTTTQSISVTVTDANDAPLANAGGPYTIDEGATLNLVASGTSDEDGDTLLFEWDLNGDSVYGDVTTETPSVSWATLQSFGIDDDGAYTIGLRVDDQSGGVVDTTASLTVNNTAPTLVTSGASVVVAGGVYTLNLSVSDPGNETISSWSIDWGDGTFETIAGNPSSATHTYTNPGFTYNILASIVDADDGVFLQNELLTPSYTRDSVFRISTTGAVTQEFATADGIDHPIEVTVGPDGNLYLSGDLSRNVLRYDVSGNFIDTFVSSGANGLTAAEGIAFGPDGNLYLADYDGRRVMRFDGSTKAYIDDFVTAASGGLDNPYGITFGPDGNLYVNSYTQDTIYRYDGNSGAFIDELDLANVGGLTEPEQMTFGPDGHLYVASFGTDNILRYDIGSGNFLDEFVSSGSGGLSEPTGIAFGPDGNLYANDHQDGEILRFNGTTGAFIDTYVTAGAGGFTRPVFLTFVPQQQVTVTTSNLPPVITSSITPTIDENQVVVQDITTTDPEADTVALSISGGTDAGLFLINGSNQLQFATAPDFESPADTDTNNIYEVEVTADDGNGGQDVELISVSVLQVNEAPTAIAPNGFNVAENTDSSAGHNLGVLSAADEDTLDLATFSIQGGADSGHFTLGGLGGDELILTDGILDFETQAVYSVTVRVTDSNLNTYDEAITVNVTDVNESPTGILPTSVTLANLTDTSGGLSISTLMASDPDASDTFTYSILPGGDALRFTIGGAGGDQLILDDGILDQTVKNTYTVTVRVTDSGFNVFDETITVTVNSNQPPTAVTPNSLAIDEHTDTTGGINLGTLTAADPDSGDAHTYTILPGIDATRFTIGGVGGDELYFDDGVLDFEVQNAYTIILRVTDSASNTFDETVNLTINNRNDSPTAISPSTIGINENTDTSSGLSLGSLIASDEDTGETFVYTIQGGSDASLFSIGGAASDELILRDGTLDFETQPSYTVVVRVTDAGLLSFDETITVEVNDLNEAPSLSLAGVLGTLREDADTSSSVKVADIIISDDALGANNLTLSGVDSDMFVVVGAEVHLAAGASLDFETQTSLNVTVEVDDTTLGASPDASQVLAISVLNVDEPAIANHDRYTVASGMKVVIAPGVLANDYDPEGAALSLILVTPPSRGSLTLNTDGSFTYTPDASFNGMDFFVYQVTDGTTSATNATVDLQGFFVPPAASISPEATTRPTETTSSDTTAPTSDDDDAPMALPGTPSDQAKEKLTSDRSSGAQPPAAAEMVSPSINKAVSEDPSRRQPIVPARSLTGRADTTETRSETRFTAVNVLAAGALREFDSLRKEIGNEEMVSTAVVGSTAVVSASLSVGYVIWLIRGGILMSSVLSSLPAWQIVDPLPVLGHLDSGGGDDDESLESILEKSNANTTTTERMEVR